MEPDKDPFYIWGSWSQNITSPLIMEFETPGKIRKLALGHSFAIMIDYKDKLWSWGYNPEGCLGLGEERRQSKVPEYVSMPHGDDLTFWDVVIGDNHVIALTTDGNIFTWGSNKRFQCGQGHGQSEIFWTPRMVELPVGVQVAKIFASQNSSYFITENGEVYSWGQNDVGQLGLSSLVDVDHPKIIESFRNKPVGELVIRGNQIISIPEVPEDSLSEMNSSQELPSVDLDMIKQQELEDAIQVKGQARAPKATLKLDQNDVMSVAASRTSKKSNRSMKSMKSQRTSRSRGTSRRGGGGDDPFSGNLKGVLVKLNDVHALLKEIDGIAEDVLEGSDKKNKKNAGWLDGLLVDLNACREEAFKFFSQLYSPEDDKETEKYKKLLAELIRDSLALRSLQITSIAMSRYKKKLEIENYVSLSTYIEGTKRVKPPDDQLRYMCLYHCKRIADKLNQKKGLFNDLCIGMSTFSTLAIKYLLDSLFSQAQLWTAMSQLIPIMNKMEADMNKKESHRSMIETLWKIYLRIQTASLDKVIALNKHEPSKIDFNEYCQEIINKSEKRVERGERDLEKFKSKSEKKFDEIIKMMFELMVENLEMRKLLNVAHRRLLGVDDVRI